MHTRRTRPDTPTTSDDAMRARRIAWTMVFIAGTLGIASALHLAGAATGSPPFDADHAGIAEALIGTALLVGAILMLRHPDQTRTAGLASTGFAIVGFLVGLSFTIRGGHAPDIAYHAMFLPVLVLCFFFLAQSGGQQHAPIRANQH